MKPLLLSYVYQVSFVAPYMGAWIETYIFVHFNAPVSSLPIWERGLKLVNGLLMRKGPLSLPIWERGLKHRISVRLPRSGLSLPIWERGLKHDFFDFPVYHFLSLPIWERGLKPTRPPEEARFAIVAPYMGAWIETYSSALQIQQEQGRSLYGSVD